MILVMVMLSIFVENPQIAQSLRRLVVQSGYDALCEVWHENSCEALQAAGFELVIYHVGVDDIEIGNGFKSGFRLGAVIDRIAFLAARLQANQDLVVGPYHLQAGQDILTCEGRDSVPVTDTEQRLLGVLADAGGKALSREILLERVWGYRADIDTHTVETHIYRLRQKIEEDPSNPQILVTAPDGAGYRLL